MDSLMKKLSSLHECLYEIQFLRELHEKSQKLKGRSEIFQNESLIVPVISKRAGKMPHTLTYQLFHETGLLFKLPLTKTMCSVSGTSITSGSITVPGMLLK
jgi:hypothetical protein